MNHIKGLNLGGWLVVERWMTPELFKGVSGGAEIDIVRELGTQAAKERLRAHRESYITLSDFHWIKRQGFDFVRLPVGYWLFEKTDDFVDGEVYVRRAFRWAAQTGLGIVLDFHGLQGSQNGADHSGQIGPVELFSPDNTSAALATIEYMAKTYGRKSSLLGLEIINEPRYRPFHRDLLKYYEDAYRIVDRHLSPQVKIIVSDGFSPFRVVRHLMRGNFGDRLVLDMHLYQLYGVRDRFGSAGWHIWRAKYLWNFKLWLISRFVTIMVGEWSAALPRNTYDGVVASEKLYAPLYHKAQRDVFSKHAWAQAYWSYTAPHCGVWSWRDSFELFK